MRPPTPAPTATPTPTPAPAQPPHALPAAQIEALTADLAARAAKALAADRVTAAIPLLRGLVAARGPASDAAGDLATAWIRAGDYAAAIDVFDDMLAAVTDPKRRRSITAARAKVASARSPLQKGVRLEPQRQVARDHFRLGRRALAGGEPEVALLHLRVGQAIDPDAPGFLRELAATYRALGDEPAMAAHYLAYLRRRPVGTLADAARAALGQSPELGRLDIRSSLPCDEVWLRGQRVGRSMPVKALALPAGSYRGLCVSYTHEIAYFERVTVPRGGRATLEFSWAVVENRLEAPAGRIAVEDPRRPGVMMDLGITAKAVGVVVPRGGGALRMRLRSDDRTRDETRTATFKPGARIVVRW